MRDWIMAVYKALPLTVPLLSMICEKLELSVKMDDAMDG